MLERVTRITKDVEPYVVFKRVSRATLLYYLVNGCKTGLEALWEFSYTCKIMQIF